MSKLLNSKRALLVLIVVVAFVAVVVPTCRMIGCNMKMGAITPFGHHTLPGMYSTCGGEMVFNSVPQAVVPSGADSLTVALIGAVLAAVALLSPRSQSRFVPVRAQAPPPPPEDPLGTRLTL